MKTFWELLTKWIFLERFQFKDLITGTPALLFAVIATYWQCCKYCIPKTLLTVTYTFEIIFVACTALTYISTEFCLSNSPLA
jgi:hypothetical protein